MYSTTLFLLSQLVLRARADLQPGCEQFEQICPGEHSSWPAYTDNPTPWPSGNDQDCLYSVVMPMWFLFKIETGGSLSFEMSAHEDIDYALYGPFDSVEDLTTSCGSYGPPMSCNFSDSPTEDFDINNFEAGKAYAWVISNFAEVRQNFTLKQTGGDAAIDCAPINIYPTPEPTSEPTFEPTPPPTHEPTEAPTSEPTTEPQVLLLVAEPSNPKADHTTKYIFIGAIIAAMLVALAAIAAAVLWFRRRRGRGGGKKKSKTLAEGGGGSAVYPAGRPAFVHQHFAPRLSNLDINSDVVDVNSDVLESVHRQATLGLDVNSDVAESMMITRDGTLGGGAVDVALERGNSDLIESIARNASLKNASLFDNL